MRKYNVLVAECDGMSAQMLPPVMETTLETEKKELELKEPSKLPPTYQMLQGQMGIK